MLYSICLGSIKNLYVIFIQSYDLFFNFIILYYIHVYIENKRFLYIHVFQDRQCSMRKQSRNYFIKQQRFDHIL